MAKPTLAPWRLYSGRTLPAPVRALSVTSFLQDVASEMVYPLLPTFLVALGGGAVTLGAMESAAEAVLAMIKGWAGRASDRQRRRPFVIAGYGLSAATRPLLALAASALQVVLLRVADRVGKGLRTAPRDALIADATPVEQRGFAFSYHRGLDHLGAAVGPLLAALILLAAPGNLRLVFALATVPALLGVLNVALRVREPVRPGGEEGGDKPRPYEEGERDRAAGDVTAAPRAAWVPRRLRQPLLAFGTFALGNASDAFLLLLAADAGASALQLTLLWSAFHVAKWAASAPAGRLADRLGAGRPLLAGWALYAVAYVGFAFAARAGSLSALGLLLLVYAVHFGLTEGAERALVVGLADDAGRGAALGAFHLVQGLGTTAASLLFAAVWEVVSPAAAFALGAALALLAAVLLTPWVARRGGRGALGG